MSKIELRVVTLGSIPSVVVDREKIARCVTTLVGNRSATFRYVRRSESLGGPGGSVLVEVEYDGASPDGTARVSVWAFRAELRRDGFWRFFRFGCVRSLRGRTMMLSGLSPHVPRTSRWIRLLVMLWSLLALRIGYAVVRGESLRDDLALPTLALFVSSALLGSHMWAILQNRSNGGSSP